MEVNLHVKCFLQQVYDIILLDVANTSAFIFILIFDVQVTVHCDKLINSYNKTN